MEFSHLKNDMVYIKGTEEDKDDILILIRDFNDKYSPHTVSYSNTESEWIERVKINYSKNYLTLLKDDLNIIFGVFGGMASLSYYTEGIGISKERFEILYESFDKIHLEVFGEP